MHIINAIRKDNVPPLVKYLTDLRLRRLFNIHLHLHCCALVRMCSPQWMAWTQFNSNISFNSILRWYMFVGGMHEMNSINVVTRHFSHHAQISSLRRCKLIKHSIVKNSNCIRAIFHFNGSQSSIFEIEFDKWNRRGMTDSSRKWPLQEVARGKLKRGNITPLSYPPSCHSNYLPAAHAPKIWLNHQPTHNFNENERFHSKRKPLKSKTHIQHCSLSPFARISLTQNTWKITGHLFNSIVWKALYRTSIMPSNKPSRTKKTATNQQWRQSPRNKNALAVKVIRNEHVFRFIT